MVKIFRFLGQKRPKFSPKINLKLKITAPLPRSNVSMHELLSSNGKISGLTFLGNNVFYLTVVTVTYKALLESTVFTWFHVLLICTSPAIWYALIFIYSSIFPYSYFGDGLMSGQFQNIMVSSVFWMGGLIIPLFVVMPDFMWRIWQEVVIHSKGVASLALSNCRLSQDIRLRKFFVIFELFGAAASC